MRKTFRLIVATVLVVSSPCFAAEKPSADEAKQALLKAVRFFHSKIAVHGGYVYNVSGDLKIREAEGKPGPGTIWVQPPGTPLVGEAFLDAYDATKDATCLQAARAAALALVHGQLHSGGWYYRIEFGPKERPDWLYRYDLEGNLQKDPTSERDRNDPGGWHVWRRRKYKGNMTILDDDTTQAALRFLMRMDQTLEFKDAKIHDAVQHGLTSLLNVQYPNGAWSANYDRFQTGTPVEKDYPIRKASYPEDWPKTWPKDFRGCYVNNDNLTPNVVRTMLRAWTIYKDKRYLESARRAGEFFILAQMPDPQPAWAQQYDKQMQPVWDRAFEAPAISGHESQSVMEALLEIARHTGDKKYLKPISPAVKYFRKSLLPDGKLSRYYELKTNRPLYFTRGRDRRHQITYDRKRLATNYGWFWEPRLDQIEAEHDRLAKGATKAAETAPDPARVRKLIDALDERGAWVEKGARLRHFKLTPESGVIASQSFADNVRMLADYVHSTK